MEMTLEQAEKEYDLIRSHGKIHIKKYKGKGGKVVIPDYIDGMPVTKIGSWAFYGSVVTEAVIPENVRCIGKSAFVFCKTLRKLSFCSKVYIEEGAFHFSGLEEIEGIEYIAGNDLDKYTFSYTPFYDNTDTFIVGDKLVWCHAVTDIYIVPQHIKTIGYLAFHDAKIKKVILPDGVKEIRSLAFFFSEIESVNIPDSVEKVGRNVFDGCYSLKDVQLPEDFGSREGWLSPLGLKIPVIGNTQVIVDNNDDVLTYKDVSCIICNNTFYNNSEQREKQIFPECLEYLKNPRLLSYAFVNVFRNDTFKVGNENKAFEPNLIFFTQYRNSRRRFRIIFDLKDSYAEVLMYFPMLPYINGQNPHPELIDFYNSCITNDKEGKFFDFDIYDGQILKQDIPFRIKAEIACERCTSNYRLTEKALNGYRYYFQYHRKKLEHLLKRDGYDRLNEFFEELLK